MTENNTEKKNRAVLVGLSSRVLAPEENADEASMEELSALLETAGGECVGVVTQSKDSPDPRTFIGEGKVAEVKEVAHAMDADMVIFDSGLSPSHQAGEQILILGQLHLEPALPGAGPLGEDVQDQGGAVQHRHPQVL